PHGGRRTGAALRAGVDRDELLGVPRQGQDYPCELLSRPTWRPTMFKTKNGLSEATRVKAVELLIARLADCIDLQTQTKHAHWNVNGPNFIALHEVFDKINEEVEDYVDDIAERAVQLGGVAEGTARMVAKRS